MRPKSTLLLLSGLAALVLMASLALGSVAGASAPSTSTQVPTPVASTATLTELANEQLASLGPNAKVVPCNSSVATLPPYTQIAPIFGVDHFLPGRRILVDGRCAIDPDATPAPLRTDSLDAP